jgi:probable H4MPT-linked C1 transfer pathway protein
LAAVAEAAAGRDVRVYLVDGRFVSLDEARELPHPAAASNWHALARFAGRYAEGRAGLLVDIGSTTTDIVPLADGRPCARGANDTERLLAGELVYTGVSRTPICAVTRTLPWRSRQCAIASEVFATTADAYIMLGESAEEPLATWTADGRPLTKPFARERLARMVCADRTIFDEQDAMRAAEFVRDAQVAQLRDAVSLVGLLSESRPMFAVISGAGEFLARRVLADIRVECSIVSLSDRFGGDVSACAPAHALAVLAAEVFA